MKKFIKKVAAAIAAAATIATTVTTAAATTTAEYMHNMQGFYDCAEYAAAHCSGGDYDVLFNQYAFDCNLCQSIDLDGDGVISSADATLYFKQLDINNDGAVTLLDAALCSNKKQASTIYNYYKSCVKFDKKYLLYFDI